MPRRNTRGSPTGGRVPALFSAAMDNSDVVNPNRRGRSPHSRTGLPRDCTSRRRLDLGATSAANRGKTRSTSSKCGVIEIANSAALCASPQVDR